MERGAAFTSDLLQDIFPNVDGLLVLTGPGRFPSLFLKTGKFFGRPLLLGYSGGRKERRYDDSDR